MVEGVTVETTTQHEALIQSLMDPNRWPEGGADRRRIDTHISTVILAGDLAYKLKKPLDLGFLDFVSLSARQRACNEELRLNSRLAPQIYQTVCAVTGSIERPQIDGAGEVLDWAVRMRRFDPDAILSKQLERIDAKLIAGLAERVADFHAETAVCPSSKPFGDADASYVPMRRNFEQILKCAPDLADSIEPLERWSREQRRRLDGALKRRKTGGHIRECHGDLHLGNVALIDGQAVLFDAIEFNLELRWIDTVNDYAFLTMDLEERGRSDLAYRFLDRYLQRSGDYEGLAVLRYYEVYRALVRAKIAAIRTTQGDLANRARTQVVAELDGYLHFATRLTEPRQGAVIITHGVSGSGKSSVAQTLPDFLPAVCLRSDIERKRMLGVNPVSDVTGRGAYSSEQTEKVYARLSALARDVAEAGYIAVVDATFIRRAQRQRFRALAESLAVPFAIVDCDAPAEVLRQRILARRNQADNVSDADLAVLEAQLIAREPLSESEQAASLRVRPDSPLDREAVYRYLKGPAAQGNRVRGPHER